MPTIPSIRTSVENKDALILDEHAKKGTFRRDAKGRLFAYAGGFSVVFPYKTSDGIMWAFRCWHSDVNNTKKRYELISETIQNANLDFLCGFEYVDYGINIEGVVYPITRMRWIEGVTIKEYICQNRNSKDSMLKLADSFLKMTNALHAQSLAHGDLQHGNILVGPDEKLYLVDYDSFYCPSLKGEADNITGLPDYQHPTRKNNKIVSEKLDYFSELIIYLSIVAIAEKPSLVDVYRVENSESLLFTKEDYEDIKNAQIYRDIYSLGGKFRDLLDVLVEYLNENDINSLKPFSEQLIENKIIFKSTVQKAIRNKQSVRVFWQVPFEADVTFHRVGLSNIERGVQGSVNAILDDDAEYVLTIKTKDGIQVTKSISIKVFDECAITFSSDKEIVFPSIPVKLEWNVTNANKVWFGSEEVEACGSKIVEPTRETVYRIRAKDEFGMKEEKITIRTLPIKQARILLASPPNFTLKQNLTVVQPVFKTSINIPQISIDWLKVEVPKVPSFTDLGLNVELSPPLLKKDFSITRTIKRVFNYLTMK